MMCADTITIAVDCELRQRIFEAWIKNAKRYCTPCIQRKDSCTYCYCEWENGKIQEGPK
jgi:hypothetical protein